jgi:superfamily II DNA or RNA helicase
MAAQHKSILTVSPTGSGKGLMTAWMAQAAQAKGSKVIIAVPKIELVEQTVEALARLGLAAGVIAARYCENPTLNIQVASIATLTQSARLERWGAWGPDLLIVDECHHLIACSWHRIVEALPHRRLIGFTATPKRLDGRGLGRIFDDMLIVATVAELVRDGWLAPVKTFAPAVLPDLSSLRVERGDYVADDAAALLSQARFVGDAVAAYRQYCGQGPALAYAANRAHACILTEHFCAAGLRAREVDGDTPPGLRKAAIAALASGEVEILVNVALFCEGLDLPALRAVFGLRPTLSEPLFLQMAGRAMRIAPGKDFGVLLDHVGNCHRHGLPEWDRQWSLDDRVRKSKTATAPVRRCPECGVMVAAATKTCPHCGCVLRVDEPAPTHAPGELVEARPEDIERARLRFMSFAEQAVWAGSDYRRLRLIAAHRGYRPGWARHEQFRVLRERARQREA